MNENNLLVIVILFFIITPIIFYILIKKSYQNRQNFINKNRENFMNMKNINYIKYNDTLPSIPDKIKTNISNEIEGNLDQCKKKCNESKECIGFIRENKGGDLTNNKCNLIKNVINCHNEYKEPSDKYIVQLKINKNKYYEYDTYFKDNVDEEQKDNIQKCIILNKKISLIHKKFPFSYLILDNNNNLKIINNDLLVENKNDETDIKLHSKKGIFEIVKGLTGQGISFKINKFNEDYYLVYNFMNEHLTSQLFEDNYVFRENATFKLEMVYSENQIKNEEPVKFVSISHIKKGNKSYWNLNNTTNKIIMTPENKKLLKDNADDTLIDDLLFEIVSPLNYNKEEIIDIPNNAPIESKGPSENNEIEKEKNDIDMNEKEKELEKLELDIRESQNKQNLKLMNIMLDVNKFKLHDLSMNNFLTKCIRTADPNDTTINNNIPKYIDKKISGTI